MSVKFQLCNVYRVEVAPCILIQIMRFIGAYLLYTDHAYGMQCTIHDPPDVWPYHVYIRS